MNMSIIKVLSLFVASGNGDRCNQMRAALRHHLMVPDQKTGLTKIYLHKNCKTDPKYKDDHYRVGREIAKIISPLLNGIPAHFYSQDELSSPSARN